MATANASKKAVAKQPDADTKVKDDSADLQAPANIKLTGFYSFYDDENVLHQWAPGVEITDPDHVELLVSRGVEHEVVG